MKVLESEQQFAELKESSRVVFLFSAEWCGACRFIEPLIFVPKMMCMAFLAS